MTLEEAKAILRRRPEYVRAAGCDSVRQYIETHVDPNAVGELFPDEDPYAVAEEILADLRLDELPDLPVSVDEMAAYLIARAAEKKEVV